MTPVWDLDFYGGAVISDPAAAYRTMLSTGPVVWLARNEILAICGFDAVTQVLRDHRNFVSGKGVSINEDVNQALIGSTLHSDPPQHDMTRAITFAPLTPKALGDVRTRVEAEAVRVADKVTNMGQFDAAIDLAPHLPLTIVRDLVGLGDRGKDRMLEWGAATFELMGDPKDRRDAAFGNLRQLRAFLESRDVLDGLTPDGWAKRATDRGVESGFAPDKAAELMRDYIAPSLDTTISSIGYAIRAFAENPDQWKMLRADRALIRNAIEEVVRLNTPIRAFSRYVLEDCEVAGHAVAGRARVLVVYGAANRDPARFDDPDRFDITRNTRGHVGFGHGAHTCLGMHLARLEMAALFDALADRVARFELTGPVEVAVNATIHAYARLPVRVVR